MKRELNEYLYWEFGIGDDPEAAGKLISADWPFVLEPAGELDGGVLFRFRDGDDDYYALHQPRPGVPSGSGHDHR